MILNLKKEQKYIAMHQMLKVVGNLVFTTIKKIDLEIVKHKLEIIGEW